VDCQIRREKFSGRSFILKNLQQDVWNWGGFGM
jgi:hypothetical protein